MWACLVASTLVWAAVRGEAEARPEAEADGSRATSGCPNVIWICLDAARAGHFSCYGYERATSPHIDKLAARGLLFEQNYAQGNATLISVPSYMTGRFFPTFCVDSRSSWREKWRIPPADERLAAQVFSDNGYATALVTSHPYLTAEARLARSFQTAVYVKPLPGAANRAYALFEQLNAEAAAWVRAHRKRPFFLYLHAMDTHLPHSLGPPDDQWVDWTYAGARKFSGFARQGYDFDFSAEDREVLRGLHDGEIHYSDRCLGQLLKVLAEPGSLSNTVVIVSADHGDALADDGKTVGHPEEASFDEVLHVPLVMAGPGIPQGRRIETLTENTDILPTLVDLLGLRTEARFDGKSLVPLLRNANAPAPHEVAFSKYRVIQMDAVPGMILRDAAFKYEYAARRNREHLWRVPDKVAARNDVLDVLPEAAERFRRRLQSEYLPLWHEYAQLPREPRGAFREPMPGSGEPRGAFVSVREDTWTNDRWGLRVNRLQSCGWREGAPPITFRLEVPNGSYRVQMQVRSARNGPEGHPASAFLLKAEGDTEYKRVVHDTGPGKGRWEYVDIGAYAVTDGVFDVTVDEADRMHWAIAEAFRFIPEDGGNGAGPTAEQSELEEQIRGLGYLE